jgi:hypothetical protein
MTDSQPGVTVVSLFHDLKLKRSIVNVLWDDGSERRALDDVQAEAEKAVRGLASEIAVIPVNPAE